MQVKGFLIPKNILEKELTMISNRKTGDRAMATTISFKIRTVKNQIAACLREIERGVKWFILQLIDLEEKLQTLLTQQLTTKPMNTTTSMIEQMISIGAEELIRREVEKNVEQNGDYETEQERLAKISSITARKVATLSKPKEAKGMARIMNHVRIREEDLNDLRVNNVSWESFYKLLCTLRGDHFDYLD